MQKHFQPASNLSDQQGITAQVEEIVMYTYLRDIQHIPPNVSDDLLNLGARRRIGSFEFPTAVAPYK